MDEQQQPGKKSGDAGYLAIGMRYSALGFEFVGILFLLGYGGYKIDQNYASDPWGLFSGLILGMGLGLYTMIKQLAKLNR